MCNVQDGRMWRVREATMADVPLMAEFRRRMFLEMGPRDTSRVEQMAEAFVPYAAEAMPHGDLIAWIAEADGEPVGTVAAVLERVPPSVRNPQGTIGYILNMYVMPEHRLRGIARALLEVCVATLRERGVGAATLHASTAGRPLYEKIGFTASSEMRLFFDEGAHDPYVRQDTDTAGPDCGL